MQEHPNIELAKIMASDSDGSAHQAMEHVDQKGLATVAELARKIRDHEETIEALEEVLKTSKKALACQCGRGEDDRAAAFAAFAQTQGYLPEQKTAVHPQTLRAFVKERCEEGDAFPMELFGAWIGQRAVIKTGKK